MNEEDVQLLVDELEKISESLIRIVKIIERQLNSLEPPVD